MPPRIVDRPRTGTGGPGTLVKPQGTLALLLLLFLSHSSINHCYRAAQQGNATDLVSRYFPGRSASPGTATVISSLPKRLNEVSAASPVDGQPARMHSASIQSFTHYLLLQQQQQLLQLSQVSR